MSLGTSYRVWPRDGAPFSSHERVALRHDFHEHPLMQLPALAELAKRLMPTRQCRFITPGSRADTPFFHTAECPDGRAIDEVFRRIDEPGSWVALYNVETDPAYRGFLDEVAAQLRPLVEPEQRGMFNVGGFIFVSSPPSVTPFHIDRENNCWLQMRGRKTLSVWDARDRDVVRGADVDDFIVYAALENVTLKDGMLARANHYATSAGDGVYFPYTSPHMTRCDDGGVSVSIGVVFYTEHTWRRANVHACNLLLRKLGLAPRPPGGAPRWVDAAKFRLGRAFVWFQRRFRGYEPSVGLLLPRSKQ